MSFSKKTKTENPTTGPYLPWYRHPQPWVLAAIAVVIVGIGANVILTDPQPLWRWIWGIIVVLVLASVVMRFQDWWRRGRKRLNARG